MTTDPSGSTSPSGAPVRVLPLGQVEAAARVTEIVGLERDLSWRRWTAEQVLAERPDKWRLSAAAHQGGRLVGVALTSRSGSAAHLHRLVVDAAVRGHGVGEMLVRHLADRASGSGLDRIEVKVGTGNGAALRFYERLGFAGSGTERGHRQLSVAAAHLVCRGSTW